MSNMIFFILTWAYISTVHSFPLANDFSQWAWQSSVVVGHWLYIDGGEYYTLSGDGSAIPMPKTLSIDISKSWTNATVNVVDNHKPNEMVLQRRPTLWYNQRNNYVYEWGGWSYYAGSDLLWTFTPDGNGGSSWTQNPAPTSNSDTSLSAPFGSSFTYSLEAFYSLGGTTGTDAYAAVSGFTIFNFTSNTWSNASSSSATNDGFSALAQAAYIPNFGSSGLFVSLGGDEPPNDYFGYEKGGTLADMSNITIYDIKTGTWYYQETSGPAPPGRSEFCMVGSAASDNSSYEIFVYGGSTNGTYDAKHATDHGYTDVFVLSLPSFHWFQVPSTQQRRAVHHCQVIGGRQMLVIGGHNPTGVNWQSSGDPWTNSLGIFDMTAWDFSAGYDAGAAAYQPSQTVQQYYASNSRYPPTWNNTDLASIFANINANTTTPAEKNGTLGGGGSNPNLNPVVHTNVGAIAGGVVGGVVAIAFLVGLILWLFKRRRQQQRGAYQPPSYPAPLQDPDYKASPPKRQTTLRHELGATEENQKLPEMVGDIPLAELR